MDEIKKSYPRNGAEVAVIGMAGRFPGAKTIDEFWDNIKNGVESISFTSEEEVNQLRNASEWLTNPNFVNSKGGVLEDKKFFDAYFFGYTPREAEIMHPQLRILHECAWEALENAGYNPDSYDGLIGFFAGAASSVYWEGLSILSGQNTDLGSMASKFLIDKDHIGTKIAHKLNLKGVSFIISTACSTGLVAIHLASRILLAGECDMVLAAGASVWVLENMGYLYQEGMILSVDGHCRAFDARAKGLVPGEGIGIVVLKLLEDALEDGDYIHAVIKGSGVNNDGNRKVGYEAPSVDGQAEVICAALRVAEVEPESITYVETHGTGTELGDPIEIAGLKLAFNTNKKGFCGIGSVKSNIGHLDAAAAIASFIKTTMALKHKIIPPTLHAENPNPEFYLEDTPFYINNKAKEWKNDKYPLRAGISSFGIGGTNVHLILEEWPEDGTLVDQYVRKPVKQETTDRTCQLILLSARTESALEQITQNMADYFKKNPGLVLADAAYTLQVGRKTFPYRRFTICKVINELIENLSDPGSRKVNTFLAKEKKKYIVFMFPGLGAQYVNMGLELYESEPIFREEMDRCFEILTPLLGYDIKEILYPSLVPDRSSMSDINQAEIAQLLLFIIEFALATLLMKWGIKPDAMIGYSFGEYTAACISGVFSLEDVLKLIFTRGKLIDKTQEGGMLSVPMPMEKVRAFIDNELSIAIDNGPSCVVSGPAEAIDAFEKKMKENRCICTRLKVSRAMHSTMMEPLLQEYKEKLQQVKLDKPLIPYISNVTGKWISVEETADPGYWAKHLSNTVLFADGVKELLKKTGSIFVEIGPGFDLGALVRHHINNEADQLIVNTLKHSQDKISDSRFLLNKIGRLWLSGIDMDWQNFHSPERRYRMPLPTYPFERQTYQVERDPSRLGAGMLTDISKNEKKPDIADWFYIPSWKRSVLPVPGSYERKERKKNSTASSWLVFEDACGLGAQLVQRLRQDGQEVIIVKPGSTFSIISDHMYSINPGKNTDYDELFNELQSNGKITGNILHLWSVTGGDSDLGLTSVERILDLGFYSLLYLAQTIGKRNSDNSFRITVIADNMHNVTGEEELCPAKTALVGTVKVIPQEYSNIDCSCIDIVLSNEENRNNQRLIDQLMLELSLEKPEKIAAIRANYCWLPTFEPIRLEKKEDQQIRLKEKGIYLITGGLGGIGFELAKHLAREVHARLVLTGRSAFPAKEEWDRWLDTHKAEENISLKIRKVQELENIGAEVLVCSANTANLEEMQVVVTQAGQRFGRINGIIHAAGISDGCVIHLRTREMTDEVLLPKVMGTLVLDHLLKDVKLDFFVMCSSLSSIIPLFGQVGYSAANAFQDAFAHQKMSHHGQFYTAINWDAWKEVGMGVDTVNQLSEAQNIKDAQVLLENGILNAEGVEVFNRILGYTLPQVVVSTSDFAVKIEQQSRAALTGAAREFEVETFKGNLYPRPELSTEYVAPGTEFEKIFANILKNFFGYDQVGIHDNFFEFGVTSLTIIRINNLLRDELKKDIPIVVMFEYPSIASLGQYLEQEEKGEPFMDNKFEEVEDLEKEEELLHDFIGLLREDS